MTGEIYFFDDDIMDEHYLMAVVLLQGRGWISPFGISNKKTTTAFDGMVFNSIFGLSTKKVSGMSKKHNSTKYPGSSICKCLQIFKNVFLSKIQSLGVFQNKGEIGGIVTIRIWL